MNGKITLSILVAFIISFLSLFILEYTFPDPLEEKQDIFYSQKFDPNLKKIFLIGASHVGQLNTTLINEKISFQFVNYTVYNLSYNGDFPEKRARSLDRLISTEPKIVFYGVSFRDLESNAKEQKPLPDPKEFFGSLISLDSLEVGTVNPKFLTLQVIREIFRDTGLFPERMEISIVNTPFFTYTNEQIVIANDKELTKQSSTMSIQNNIKIKPTSENQQVNYLEKIISKLQNNNIKVVLFTTPHHKYYLEQLPDSEKKVFSSILEEISDEYGVKIYYFTDKYADLAIWANINHVAYSKQSMIYSDDITNMISREIEY